MCTVDESLPAKPAVAAGVNCGDAASFDRGKVMEELPSSFIPVCYFIRPSCSQELRE